MFSTSQIKEQLRTPNGFCIICFSKACATLTRIRSRGDIQDSWNLWDVEYTIQGMLDEGCMQFCIDCMQCFTNRKIFWSVYHQIEERVSKELDTFSKDIKAITNYTFKKLNEPKLGQMLAEKWKWDVTPIHSSWSFYKESTNHFLSSSFIETKNIQPPGIFWIEAEKTYLDHLKAYFNRFRLNYIYCKKIGCTCEFNVDVLPCECDAKHANEKNLMRLEISLEEIIKLRYNKDNLKIKFFTQKFLKLPPTLHDHITNFLTPRDMMTIANSMDTKKEHSTSIQCQLL